MIFDSLESLEDGLKGQLSIKDTDRIVVYHGKTPLYSCTKTKGGWSVRNDMSNKQLVFVDNEMIDEVIDAVMSGVKNIGFNILAKGGLSLRAHKTSTPKRNHKKNMPMVCVENMF